MLTQLLDRTGCPNMRFPVSDLLTCVNQLCAEECQHLWSQCTSDNSTVSNR